MSVNIHNRGIGEVFGAIVEATLLMANSYLTVNTQLQTGVCDQLKTMNESFKSELKMVLVCASECGFTHESQVVAEGQSLQNERKDTYELLKKVHL